MVLSMLMLRHSDKERGEEREDVSLKERDEEFQTAKRDAHRQTSDRHERPEPDNTRRSRNKRDEDRQHHVTGEHIRQKTNGENDMLDRKSVV